MRKLGIENVRLTIFKVVLGLAVAFVGESRPLGFQCPRLNLGLNNNNKSFFNKERRNDK